MEDIIIDDTFLDILAHKKDSIENAKVVPKEVIDTSTTHAVDDFVASPFEQKDSTKRAVKVEPPVKEVEAKDYSVSHVNRDYQIQQWENSPFNPNNINRTIQETNSIIGFDGTRKESYKPRVVDWNPTQPAQEIKVAEQTPVEESTPTSTPVAPLNFQDYQDLGEYQQDNTVPNSSIEYVMPPIERKSLEMPQSDNSEQISSVRDFLSGISSIPAYVYHNKVVPFIDETREKLFGPSEEELARRAAEEEQERLRLEEEARIAREQFVQDSIQHDINQRTEDILARIAAMDTSYVVGRYNGRNLVSGLATPGNSRFLGTNRKQKTNVKGYNILAPWNNWSILDENTTAKSIEDNHFIKGNKHQKYGQIDPSVARYISVDEEGNLLFTDTIPRGIRGQITTGYASTGNLSDSFKKNKSIRYPEVYYNDGTKSYPIFSWINPYNLNSVYHPVQAAVLFDLPNGEKSWIILYGRTANQFYNDVTKIKNITGDDELEFVNFDSRSATGAYGDAGIRYNKFGSYPSLILRKKFGGNMRHSLYSDRPQARFGLKSIGKKIYNFTTDLYDRLFNKNYSTIKKMEALTANQDSSEESYPTYIDENEERYKQYGYIGGNKRKVRQRYFDIDKELSDSVRSISSRYGLRPEVVASRIAEEGPIDNFIRYYNSKKGALFRNHMYGPQWGLDDIYTNLLNGNVKFTNPIPYDYNDVEFTNEKGRTTYSITSPNWELGVEGNAAELKYRRDLFKQQFPNISDEDLDAAAAMSFNMGTTGAYNFYKKHGYVPKKYYPYIKMKDGGRISLETVRHKAKKGEELLEKELPNVEVVASRPIHHNFPVTLNYNQTSVSKANVPIEFTPVQLNKKNWINNFQLAYPSIPKANTDKLIQNKNNDIDLLTLYMLLHSNPGRISLETL